MSSDWLADLLFVCVSFSSRLSRNSHGSTFVHARPSAWVQCIRDLIDGHLSLLVTFMTFVDTCPCSWIQGIGNLVDRSVSLFGLALIDTGPSARVQGVRDLIDRGVSLRRVALVDAD